MGAAKVRFSKLRVAFGTMAIIWQVSRGYKDTGIDDWVRFRPAAEDNEQVRPSSASECGRKKAAAKSIAAAGIK
jgi:hypothetical protein